MNIKIKNYDQSKYMPKFQQGGEMPAGDPAAAPAEAPAAAPEAGGEDPTQQLLMACQQALETQDCQLAMQVLQAIMQMAGGGGEPAPAAPEGQEPVYRKGGRLIRFQKKF